MTGGKKKMGRRGGWGRDGERGGRMGGERRDILFFYSSRVFSNVLRCQLAEAKEKGVNRVCM